MKNYYEEVLETKNTVSVGKMFDKIAPKYDFINHFLSFNIDKYWRNKAIKELSSLKNDSVILDLATGTGDLAKEIIQKVKPKELIAIDISESMLNVAQKKLALIKTNTQVSIKMQAAEQLDCKENSIDAVTIAFGVRNFNNLRLALSNIYNILKPDSKLVIIEFSHPKNGFVKFIYEFYFNKIIPFIGKIISGHSFAYRYLTDSVNAFPTGEKFLAIMKESGFYNNNYKVLTFGICSIYVGYKKPDNS